MKNKQLPDEGFNESQIESILAQVYFLDHPKISPKSRWQTLIQIISRAKVGAGEREGRVYSNMVLSRHFNLSHGIGESSKTIN